LKLADLPIRSRTGAGVDPRGSHRVNFVEIIFARRIQAALPLTPGSEAAGTVEELGPG